MVRMPTSGPGRNMSRSCKTRPGAHARLGEPTQRVPLDMPSPSSTPLIDSLNHAAILTLDLGRFLDFHCGVLGLEHVFSEETPSLRHAIVRCGSLSWLHPVEVAAPARVPAAERALERGRLDHIALTVATAQAFADLRRRPMACGASDGRIDDLGAFQTMSFSDPDGMRVELTLVVDPSLRHVHAPTPHVPSLASVVSIERLSDRERWPVIDSLLREYVPWAVERLEAEHGIRFDDVDAEMERHHASFAADADAMLAGRGRLLLAHLHARPAGLVALKPVDDDVAEVKRLFVRQSARGHSIGRALLYRLIAAARAEGFRTLRLETTTFMREARAIYAAFGFRDVPAFAQARAAMPGLTDVVRFMELPLRH